MLRRSVLLLALVAATPAVGRTTALTDADIAQRAVSAVVTFSMWKIRPPAKEGDTPRRVKTYGSGFIIDPGGLIVTNKHVVQDAVDTMVILDDGVRVHGMVVGTAAIIDLALVRVNVGRPLTALHWGDSNLLRVGDPVLTVGNPMAVGMSVSAGIVSALNRNLLDTPLDDYIQTDAAINRGNSGGPLINRDGNVVGVNSAFYNTEPNGGFVGIGYAIPAEEAKFVIDRLLDPSHPKPGWLGVKLQDVTPNLAGALDLPVPLGSIIADVDPSGPAAKASLQPGDILQSMDDISPADSRAFIRKIAMIPAGQQITLVVWRAGKTLRVPVTVAEWPDRTRNGGIVSPSVARTIMERPPDWGLTLEPISEAARKQFGLDPKVDGVLVSSVAVGCEADDLGVEAGDIIEQVQGQPVSTPADVDRALTLAHDKRRPFAALLVEGKRGKRWVSLSVSDGS